MDKKTEKEIKRLILLISQIGKLKREQCELDNKMLEIDNKVLELYEKLEYFNDEWIKQLEDDLKEK